jgi:hypothetical protein
VRLRLIALAAGLALPAAGAPPQPPSALPRSPLKIVPSAPRGVREATRDQAQALLAKAMSMDAGSRKVMQRAVAAYGKLKTLEAIGRSGEETTYTRVQRPNLLSCLQMKGEGNLLSLSACDGTGYYEYYESSRSYVQREVHWLKKIALPSNARLFFAGKDLGAPMVALDGKAAVREYAYRYAGRQKVNGKPADVLHVSTVTRAGGRWFVFDSIRCFDAATGLLVRTVNGDRRVDITNRPNKPFRAGAFRWTPPPGATKGFR